MAYMIDVVRKRNSGRSQLRICWLAATLSKSQFVREVKKTEINNLDIVATCDEIIEQLDTGTLGQSTLYTSSQLSFGVVKTFLYQVSSLEDEVEKLLGSFNETKDSLTSKMPSKKKPKVVQEEKKVEDRTTDPFFHEPCDIGDSFLRLFKMDENVKDSHLMCEPEKLIANNLGSFGFNDVSNLKEKDFEKFLHSRSGEPTVQEEPFLAPRLNVSPKSIQQPELSHEQIKTRSKKRKVTSDSNISGLNEGFEKFSPPRPFEESRTAQPIVRDEPFFSQILDGSPLAKRQPETGLKEFETPPKKRKAENQDGSLTSETAATPSPGRPRFGNQFQLNEPQTADEIPAIPDQPVASSAPKKLTPEIHSSDFEERKIAEKTVTSTPNPWRFGTDIQPEIESFRDNNRRLRPVNKKITVKVNKKNTTLFTVKRKKKINLVCYFEDWEQDLDPNIGRSFYIIDLGCEDLDSRTLKIIKPLHKIQDIDFEDFAYLDTTEGIFAQENPEQVMEMAEENNFDLSIHEPLPRDSDKKERKDKTVDSKKKKRRTDQLEISDEQPNLGPEVPIFDDVEPPEAPAVPELEKDDKSFEFAVPDRPKPKIISNVRKMSPVRLIRSSEARVGESDESFLAGVPGHVDFGASESSSEEIERRLSPEIVPYQALIPESNFFKELKHLYKKKPDLTFQDLTVEAGRKKSAHEITEMLMHCLSLHADLKIELDEQAPYTELFITIM